MEKLYYSLPYPPTPQTPFLRKGMRDRGRRGDVVHKKEEREGSAPLSVGKGFLMAIFFSIRELDLLRKRKEEKEQDKLPFSLTKDMRITAKARVRCIAFCFIIFNALLFS